MLKKSPRTVKDSALNVVDAWKGIGKWVYLVVKSVANWLWGVFVLWYDALKAGDKYIWKAIKKNKPWKFLWFLSDKMLRTLWALGVAWWLFIWWQKIDFKHLLSSDEWTMTEFLWEDSKVFGLDISRFNQNDVDIFTDWSESLDNSDNEDKRRPKFIYILWRKEKAEDPKAREHYQKIKEHKDKLGKDMAVWTYAYFDKSEAGITDEWIENQVNEFIQIYNVINEDGDWLVDLVPMLDFEFSRNESVIRANTAQWKRYGEAVLKWLKLFEKKTWVTPGIYANASTYHDYFYANPSFAKCPAWIACYSDDRVDQEKGIVTYQGDQMHADIIQFSEKIKKSGLWNKHWNVDWNTSTQWEFWKLIQNNSDTPKR